MLRILPLLLSVAGGPRVPAPAAPVKVVTSLTTYAAIAREIVGDRGVVSSIAVGDENPHYVQPKPSFVPLLAQADVFVTTGLDLELWVPALLDKAGNPKVTEGGAGYVAAYAGITLLDVPSSFSRTQGDIHVFGNPHIWTDPLNAIFIARNILTGLRRVSPENADFFAAREKDFEDRLSRALFGDDLVKLLGARPWSISTSRASSSTSSRAGIIRAIRSSIGWEAGSRPRCRSGARWWPAITRNGTTSRANST